MSLMKQSYMYPSHPSFLYHSSFSTTTRTLILTPSRQHAHYTHTHPYTCSQPHIHNAYTHIHTHTCIHTYTHVPDIRALTRPFTCVPTDNIPVEMIHSYVPQAPSYTGTVRPHSRLGFHSWQRGSRVLGELLHACRGPD